MPLAAPAKVELLSAVVGKGTAPEQQSAVRALASVPGTASTQALARLADGLTTGGVAPGVQLDVLEAMRATKNPTLQQRLDRLKIANDFSNVGTVFPQALTTGGSL